MKVEEIELLAHQLLKLFLDHYSIIVSLRCHLEACSAEIILGCAIAVMIACRSGSPLGHLWRRIKRVIAFILFKAL